MAPPFPPDPFCGLGHSPSDPRQSEAEATVLVHAERLLNMIHAYCEIRDSWTGWLRGGAMGRTLHERIVPEMRALRDAERRVVDRPSVALLAVLDYAERARAAVTAYTPLGIDYPQPPVSAEVREACARMIVEAEQAALAARQAHAREYAARMADAIERERAEEARRQQAMANAGVTETAEEAARAAAAVEARVAVYVRERERVLAEAGLDPDEEPVADAATPGTGDPDDLCIAWVHGGGGYYHIDLEASGSLPAFIRRPGRPERAMVLVDRHTDRGRRRALKVWTDPVPDKPFDLTVNGRTVTLAPTRPPCFRTQLSEDDIEDLRA